MTFIKIEFVIFRNISYRRPSRAMFWGEFPLSRTSVIRMHRVSDNRSFCRKFYVMETNSGTGALARILAVGFISGLWPFQTRRLFIHSFTIFNTRTCGKLWYGTPQWILVVW